MGAPHLTEGGIEQELPLLLDPCNRSDVQLISFMRNQVVSTSEEQDCKNRVEVSASIYNFDNEYIKPERGRVWDDTAQTIDEYIHAEGDTHKADCLRRLKDAVDRNAQFSACAIACVNSLAPDEIKAQLDLML